jgi:hypothetical protein
MRIPGIGTAWDLTLDAVLSTRLIERTVDRLLAEGVIERVVLLVIEHPATDRLVTTVVESQGVERLVTRVVQADAVDRFLNGVLASEQLQRIVSHIAESDEVTAALTRQSMGLADEAAGELRSRTMTADDRLERIARSLIRRRQVPRDGDSSGDGAS